MSESFRSYTMSTRGKSPFNTTRHVAQGVWILDLEAMITWFQHLCFLIHMVKWMKNNSFKLQIDIVYPFVGPKIVFESSPKLKGVLYINLQTTRIVQ